MWCRLEEGHEVLENFVESLCARACRLVVANKEVLQVDQVNILPMCETIYKAELRTQADHDDS